MMKSQMELLYVCAIIHISVTHFSIFQQLGLKEEYFIWKCYGSSTPPFYWRILIFSYLVILQIIGIMLAFQTRKVKFPGLNDSVFVAAIIYTSSIVLVILMVDTFILNNYLNTFGAIFTVGIVILTTVFLAFTFVPKVTHMCPDAFDHFACATYTHKLSLQNACLLVLAMHYSLCICD